MKFWILALLSLTLTRPASANPDIDAAARSVVRIIVIGTDAEGTQSTGMGSGVAITPSRIITNAHVVADAVNNDGFIGIVPSEGRKRYEGKVIAYAPNLDLAIIDIGAGKVAPAALFGGMISPGSDVAALGYPYGVDRALANGMAEMIAPQSPLQSLGHVAAKRSNAQFDTVVHDANIGRGNSGGPLVDFCGRVVGINTFLSVSEGIDSTFAFAISANELQQFLARAGVKPNVVTTPCLTGDAARQRDADMNAADQQAAALDAHRADADTAKATARKAAIHDEIGSERDSGFAIAGALFVLGALASAGGGILVATKRKTPGWIVVGVGSLLIIAALFTFVARPKFSDVDDRFAAEQAKGKPVAATAAASTTGAMICTFQPDRSVVKISKTDDVPMTWQESGCVNGKTQYSQTAGVWSRAFVPNGEQAVTVQSYDPAKRRYTVERYLMDADAMDKARAIRGRYKNNSCTADPKQVQSVVDMETAVRGVLTQGPNERMVFDCHATSGGDTR